MNYRKGPHSEEWIANQKRGMKKRWEILKAPPLERLLIESGVPEERRRLAATKIRIVIEENL